MYSLLIDFAYTPIYFFMFYFLTTCFCKKIIAQNTLSTANALGVITMKWVYEYIGHRSFLMRHGIIMCMSYFLYDTLIIIFSDLSQWQFIIHHVIALCVGYGISNSIFDAHASSNYLAYIELSNIVMGLWDSLKQSKDGVIGHALYEIVTPLHCLTYVPLRTIVITKTTYDMILSIKKYHVFFTTMLLLVLALSYYFSIKMVKIYVRKVRSYKFDVNVFVDKFYDFYVNTPLVMCSVGHVVVSQIMFWNVIPYLPDVLSQFVAFNLVSLLLLYRFFCIVLM